MFQSIFGYLERKAIFLLVLSIFVAAWLFFPISLEVALNANLVLWVFAGKAIAFAVPASWGGEALDSLATIVQGIATAVKGGTNILPYPYGTRTEIILRAFPEGLALFLEIKFVAWVLWKKTPGLRTKKAKP